MRVEDLGADHVGGQHVGRELDAREARVDGAGQAAHGQRLGQARHALEQHVAAGQQADQQARHHRLLADEDLADLGDDLVTELRVLRRDIAYGFRHDGSSMSISPDPSISDAGPNAGPKAGPNAGPGCAGRSRRSAHPAVME